LNRLVAERGQHCRREGVPAEQLRTRRLRMDARGVGVAVLFAGRCARVHGWRDYTHASDTPANGLNPC
jgi:hypothetical protein